jgi:adenylate cyclase
MRCFVHCSLKAHNRFITKAACRTMQLALSQEGPRLATIMSIDMITYQPPGQKNEPVSGVPSDEQRKLFRSILGRYDGRELKTNTSSFIVEFPGPLEAARCASDIQKMIRDFNSCAPPKLRIKFRIGIHLGDVVESQGGVSVEAVNVARSISKYASICMTRQISDHLQGKFKRKIQSLGTRSVKSPSGPIELLKVVLPWEEVESKGFGRTRIAVLPFANNSPSLADDFFAFAMSEQVVASLSRIGDFQVIGRASVVSNKGGSRPVEEVARELEAGTMLDGSVRKAGDRVQITTELIDSSTSERLWSERYDRHLKDMLSWETEIAQAVAEELKVRFSPREKVLFARKRTVNPDAYSLYLKGQFNIDQATRDSIDRAVRCLKQAVHVDPEFAMGYSGLADCYNIQADRYWAPPGLAVSLAKTSSTKALEIDPSIGEAHAALGLALSRHYWEFATAENEFKRAITLSPSYAPAHHWYSEMLLYTRRFDESYEEEKQALLHDPYSPRVNMGMANLLALLGRVEEAMERYRQLLGLGREYANCHVFKSMLHMSLSEYEPAVNEANKAVESEKSWFNQAVLGWAYGSAGRRDGAGRILDELARGSAGGPVSPVWTALLELALGKQEEAFRMLEKALIVKDPDLLLFASLPWFKDYRLDPRWERIEARMGLSKLSR